MSSPLTAEAVRWVTPAKVHIGGLNQFTCCEKARKFPPKFLHPQAWRERAQGLVRGMQPPFRPPDYGLLGLDDQGVAAATWFTMQDGNWHVNVLAVALRWQRRRLGDHLVQRLHSEIASLACERGESTAAITARVHPKNVESRAMLTRWGYVDIELPLELGELPMWATSIPTR